MIQTGVGIQRNADLPPTPSATEDLAAQTSRSGAGIADRLPVAAVEVVLRIAAADKDAQRIQSLIAFRVVGEVQHRLIPCRLANQAELVANDGAVSTARGVVRAERNTRRTELGLAVGVDQVRITEVQTGAAAVSRVVLT